MANQRIIGLAVLIVALYFLVGGIFNADWALRALSGQTPTGFARKVVRAICVSLGSVMLLTAGIMLLAPAI